MIILVIILRADLEGKDRNCQEAVARHQVRHNRGLGSKEGEGNPDSKDISEVN